MSAVEIRRDPGLENSNTAGSILIISYLFPPMGGIGVQRALSLAKYLPNSGFRVHVLKASNAGGPVFDPDLLRQVPAGVTVHSAFTPEIPFAIRQRLWARLTGRTRAPEAPDSTTARARFSVKQLVTASIKKLLSPEPEILWVPFAVRRANQIIRREKIDTVLVTVPPFSALVAGAALKRRFPSIKLVSDFRDEWLSFYLKDFEFQNDAHTRRRAETIERESVERSDLVVAVNQSSRDVIRARYPGQPDSKFAVVPNGYDPEIFAGFQPRSHHSSRMVVTHVGTVYQTASPRFYLEALDRLPEEIHSQIETRFVGRISNTEQVILESRKSPVKVLGFMPQAEALKIMEETDYLLLTMTNDISVPGKLFEYMASGKPILAVAAPDSEVDRILWETGCGISAAPNELASIQTMLMKAYEAWRARRPLVEPGKATVQRYERPRLANEYANLIRVIRVNSGQACG